MDNFILNAFLILSVCQMFQPIQGHFTVKQQYKINSDQSAFFICEHDAQNGRLADVRLYKIFTNGTKNMLCQKGRKSCVNISMHLESKFFFKQSYIKPEDMDCSYQCEITWTDVKNYDHTKSGSHFKIKKVSTTPDPPFTNRNQAADAHPPCQPSELRWILIGLLVLFVLYSFILTCFYLRLRMSLSNSKKTFENSTYVIMKKTASTRYKN